MILYLDTSALLKLYIDEQGSQDVRSLIGPAKAVFTHIIAYAELRAALAKAMRMKRISSGQHTALVADVDSDWLTLNIVDVDMPLVRRAGALAELFGLRGFDSIHLAAAEWLHATAGGHPEFAFAAFDRGLCSGAKTIGLRVLGR